MSENTKSNITNVEMSESDLESQLSLIHISHSLTVCIYLPALFFFVMFVFSSCPYFP